MLLITRTDGDDGARDSIRCPDCCRPGAEYIAGGTGLGRVELGRPRGIRGAQFEAGFWGGVLNFAGDCRNATDELQLDRVVSFGCAGPDAFGRVGNWFVCDLGSDRERTFGPAGIFFVARLPATAGMLRDRWSLPSGFDGNGSGI